MVDIPMGTAATMAAAAIWFGDVGARRVKSLQRVLCRDLGMLGRERRVGDIGHEQLVVEPLGVAEDQARVDAARLDAALGEARH